MREGRTKRNNYPPRGGAAMSFEEIGEQLGLTKAGAREIFVRAIRKLRASGEMQRLRDIAQVLDRERAA